MFEYLFPIFAFGVVISAVVGKGVLTARDMEKAERATQEQLRSRVTIRSQFPAPGRKAA